MRVGILLTLEKHWNHLIISPGGEVWAHKASLTSPLFIEMPVSIQERERYGLSILHLSAIFLLHFGTVSTVWYYLLFH